MHFMPDSLEEASRPYGGGVSVANANPPSRLELGEASRDYSPPNLNLNTRDIDGAHSKGWTSTKNVNPLDPDYLLSTKSGRQMVVGRVDGSKPR